MQKKSSRTSGGHRRYKLSDLEKFIGEYHVEGNQTDDVIVATYERCSTSDQKQHGDIDRQSQRLSEYCAKKKYKVEYIIKDMGNDSLMHISIDGHGMCEMHRRKHEKCPEKLFIE